MSVEILSLLSAFRSRADEESQLAYFRVPVSWLGPHAYLNIVFKPCPQSLLAEAARRLRMPSPLIDFLKLQNGASLFAGALGIYGVRSPGQLLKRDERLFHLPFDIEEENYSWPPFDCGRLLAIGGYGFDGSTVCIDRSDLRVHLFRRGDHILSATASASWRDLDEWISNEISRLSSFFDQDGKRLVDESLTVPPATAAS